MKPLDLDRYRKEARSGAMFRNRKDEEIAMHMTFIARDPDSNPTGSPTLYRTDRQTWVVQGWDVIDPEAVAQMAIPAGESAVEIPDRMIQFFRQEDRDVHNQ